VADGAPLIGWELDDGPQRLPQRHQLDPEAAAPSTRRSLHLDLRVEMVQLDEKPSSTVQGASLADPSDQRVTSAGGRLSMASVAAS